ncbi:phosphatase PAP2 family protein [Natronolimnobius sp. AArcel1]|uniref:phosphatase PAP2 family protein n=1 Tax=Natronolimnobius sp. AArcel1 TaxID=1679093 RepID=UPI0013EB65FB|nr:phosphatase PAP2 family protein [Natronolimnobius sp. AArcel1]NGM69894.1 phosphatase PAP2 family protein [Natronolimnobius sp. AArcel1]
MLFDGTVVDGLTNAIPVWLAVALLIISFLGSVYVVIPGLLWASLFGDRRRTMTWSGIVIGGYGIFVTLKPLFSVPRPATNPPFGPDLLPAGLSILYDLGLGFTSSSFPSGHAIAATVFWGLVAVDSTRGSRRQRVAVCVAIIVLVALSRVALGVHYPGDVLAGIVLGGLYLAGTLAIRARVSRPVPVLLGLGSVLALGGVFTGRPDDALILCGAAVAAGLVARYYPVSRKHSPGALSS